MSPIKGIREDTPFKLSCIQWELILAEAERQKETEQNINRASYLRRIIDLITIYSTEIDKCPDYEISIVYDLVDTFRELQTATK
jgi:hypothetical protein